MYAKIILKFTLKYCLFVEIARVCSFYDNLTGNKDISDQIRQTRLPPIYLKLFDTEDLMKMGFEKFQAVLISKHQDGSSVVKIKEKKKKRREQVVGTMTQKVSIDEKLRDTVAFNSRERFRQELSQSQKHCLTDDLLDQLLCQGRNSICDEDFRYILVADEFSTVVGLSWVCDIKFEVVVDLDEGRGLLEQLQHEYPEKFADVQSKYLTEPLTADVFLFQVFKFVNCIP